MRSISPMWGFVGLILAAVLVSSLVSSKHTNTGALPPAEQAKIDEQKQIEEANKYNAAHKNTPADKGAPANKTTSADNPTPPTATDSTPMTFAQVKEGAVKVTMKVEGKGTVVMELYPKAAPKTVAHFIELCRSNFYAGIKFHRLERKPASKISVLQGGDPESKTANVDEFEAKGIGSHGSGTTTVPLEARLPHTKYSVGQARFQAPDSGDCQFYINLDDNTALDRQYCVFGMVVEGQDVVDKIEKGDVITSLTP